MELAKRTSGGIVSELAQFFCTQGYIVYGVCYSKDFSKTQHVRINNVNDLPSIQGTKYVQADNNNIYKRILSDLKNHRRVFFVGLPCEVAALSCYVKEYADSLFLCELVCHGSASSKVSTEYMDFLKKKFNCNLVEFNVRHKKCGWFTPYLKAVFEDGTIFEKEFYKTEYGEAFALVGRQSCYNCNFKGNMSYADITVGDYWGGN